MSSYQQQKEEDSPAIEYIRNLDIFQSNVRPGPIFGTSNSERLAMMQAQQSGTQVSDSSSSTAQELPQESKTALDQYLPLERGAKGAGVMLLQAKLNELGASLVADGDFGGKTASVVRMFQMANALSRTGIVDRETASTMYASEAKHVDEAELEGVPGQYLGEFEAYRDGKHIGAVDVVELNGKKVASKTAKAWQTLRDAAAADGIQLKLNSGFRTMDEQKHLYAKYGSPRAALPGHSNHQHGQALDIDAADPKHKKWLFDNAPSFGWRNTVSFEPWHWEYFGN